MLAGGRSTRMGTSKAALRWDGATLLARTCAILARAVGGPLLVVGSPGRELPALPPGVRAVADPKEGRGPLQGLATGLAAVASAADVAFVCATDLPFLQAAFVRRVLAALGAQVDLALPVVRGRPQPLAAAYRTAVAPLAEARLARGDLRLLGLAAEVCVARLDEAALLSDPALAAADPALRSVVNVNDPAAYAAARRRVGRDGPALPLGEEG
ncbi:MAG: molybdenum cofactor guanylyltransferase [Egibacteraceae bacterium]